MIKIGIDPDSLKSGVVAMQGNEIVMLENMEFFTLIEYLNKLSTLYDNYIVIIEQGEKNKALFSAESAARKTKGNKLKVAAKTGMSTGKNFAITDLLIEFCEKMKINYKTYTPTIAKWNHKFTSAVVKNMTKQSNQEIRDAIRCCFLG